MGELNHLSQVQRFTVRLLADLLATAKSIRYDDGGILCFPHSRKQTALADLNGDGTLDVVTANDDHTASILKNLGRPARHRAVRP